MVTQTWLRIHCFISLKASARERKAALEQHSEAPVCGIRNFKEGPEVEAASLLRLKQRILGHLKG
jgi:hypothetical protein